MFEGEEEVEGSGLNINLAQTLEERSGMFTVAGVFAALAIYLSRLTDGSIFQANLMLWVGFGSAFALSLISIGLFYSFLKDEVGGWHRLLHAHLRFENIALFTFTLGIILISLSFAQILTQRQTFIFLALMLATVGLALAILIRVTYGLGRFIPYSPTWRIALILVVSVSTLLVTDFLYGELIARYSITEIQQLSYDNPGPILVNLALTLVVTLRSLAATGILAVPLGVVAVIIDKLRGKSPYD